MVMLVIGLLRFCMLSLLLVLAFILIFISVVIPVKLWRYVVKYWCRVFFMILGIKITITGHSNLHSHYNPNTVVVANHISWLDIPLINSIFSVSFISMQELRSWFIVGFLAEKLNTIFISRANKKDLLRINQQVSKVLQRNGSVMFFPEGATSTGESVKDFKSSLFESVIMSESKIIPLVLSYTIKGKRTQGVTYAGGINFWQAFKNVLCLHGIEAKVDIMPKLTIQPKDNRIDLANKAYQQIAMQYNKYWSI